jgi:hypothetical protein
MQKRKVKGRGAARRTAKCEECADDGATLLFTKFEYVIGSTASASKLRRIPALLRQPAQFRKLPERADERAGQNAAPCPSVTH